MRAVCFVKRLEFEFTGNVFQNAISLGDVTNDGNNELIVGNMSGDLAIYKHDRLWQKFSGLGMITAVVVGDILNCKSNALVVVSGCGYCNILKQTTSVAVDDLEKPGRLAIFHTQRIPANTKVALLADIDNDGDIELVLGLTDRVVRSYRWLTGSDESSHLLGLNKWECANQIGTVTLNRSADGTPSLLVAQPGGSIMRIHCISNNKNSGSSNTERDGLDGSSVEYHPLCFNRMRNINVSTEILGGIRPLGGDGSEATRCAIATLDGTLMLIQDQEILWSMQVDHQVFGIRALDVTGDGYDEIVACSWDGQTYILDQDRNSVRFQMEEPVECFTAGQYKPKSGEPSQPSIVYTTFTNKVYVYHNVRIPSMVARSVQFDVGLGLDETQTMQLVQWCLYGKR